MPSCIKAGVERHRECSQTEDQGYEECAETRDEGYRDCCDWWPCSWACDAWVWVSNIVCVASNWVSNIVCVAWTWVTTAICVVADVATSVLNIAIVTLESILGWVLSAVTFFVELIMTIPGFGALVRWGLNFLTHFIYILVGIIDAGLGLIGIRPEKKLRVCTIILRDENFEPVATVEFAKAVLQTAVNVYKRDANVRIVPLKPFQYDSGFADAETVDDSWVIIDNEKSDREILDVPGGGGGGEADWGHAGSQFQLKMSTRCFYGSWRRVIGYGAPVTCFIVRSVPGSYGHALWATNYVRIEGEKRLPPSSPRTLAHELGHSCNLTHTCVDDDNQNMMATQDECELESLTRPDRVNPRMDNWQVIKLRASKHVTYF